MPRTLQILLLASLPALGAWIVDAPAHPGTPARQELPPLEDARPAPPTRVYVVVDRFREFGGTLVREDEQSFTIRRDEREETYEKDKVLAEIASDPRQDTEE